MAILIGAQNLSKTYGPRPLFQNLSFSVADGDRIGLIGPNGAGKSTLLRMLAGQVTPDSGTLSLRKGLRVGFLEQVPRFNHHSTVEQSVMEGASDAHDGDVIAQAQELIAKLELADYTDRPIEELSGGWKKRVALARELLRQPDVLLLDEPTNHLDVESILWLEGFLARAPFATVTITHDRVFLQKVSNRIIELNRRFPDGLFSVRGNYLTFLEAKEALLTAQASTELKLRNTLRRETEWLRRGAKARTTKQEARIQRAHDLAALTDEVSERNASANAQFEFVDLGRSPQKLVEAKKIRKSYGDRTVIPDFSYLVTPKTRLGLLGPNGCGKSTLLRLLLKKEEGDTGSVFHSDSLRISYFEQNRDALDPDLSVLRTVCPKGDFVQFGGKPIHVRSYLDRFLFSGPQADMPVGRLSGGEQSRILLALLMLQEANLLVLDEPTNDLDMTTLDLLQDVLDEFNGAVILVSHDRYFLDQVTTEIIGFGRNTRGDPELVKFSGVDQWQTWHDQNTGPKAKPAPAKAASEKPAAKKKLGFKNQRELDGMEAAIETAEARLAALTRESEEVASNATKLLAVTEEMSAIEKEIERLYARWAELTQ